MTPTGSRLAALLLALACLVPTWAQAPPPAQVKRLPVRFTFPVPQDGYVSVGICDSTGKLVRTLFSHEALNRASNHSIGDRYIFAWDGTDDAGRPLPAGTYQYKSLVANVSQEYVLTAGTHGNPCYRTRQEVPMVPSDTGGWGGLWGRVQGVACDSGGVYLAWDQEEEMPALLKVTPQGQKIWGAHWPPGWPPYGRLSNVVSDGEYVYVLNNAIVTPDGKLTHGTMCGPQKYTAADCSYQPVLWRVNAATGEYAKFDRTGATGPSAKLDWPFVGKPAPAIPPEEITAGTKETPDWSLGLAVYGDHLYVALRYEDRIAVIDKRTGQETSTIDGIKSPLGLAADARGNLFVVSQNQIVKISPEGKILGPVVSAGLDAPFCVAVDKAGNLHVTDRGSSQQVKKFSPQGKLLLTLGKPGGRPRMGSWEANQNDFLRPTGVAALADGTVIVGEDSAPKRVAVIRGGRIVDNWLGPLCGGAGMGVAADPERPEIVYQITGDGYIIRYLVDYEQKTWKLDAYWDGLIWPLYMAHTTVKPDMITASHGGAQVVHYNGRTFLTLSGPEIRTILRVDGYDLSPCAAIIPGGYLRYFEEFRPETRDALKAKCRNWQTDFVIWRDLNGDWQVQPDELECYPGKTTFDCRGAYFGNYFDSQMNLWTAPDPVQNEQHGDGTIREFLCSGLDERGNPIYSPDKVRVVLRDAVPTYHLPWWHWDVTKSGVRDYNNGGGIWVDEKDGSLYVPYLLVGPDEGVDYGSLNMDSKLEKFNAAGDLVWRTGRKAKGFAHPGEFYRINTIAGEVKGCLFAEDMDGQLRVFDADSGLFVADILEDPYRGNWVGPNVDWLERVNGSRVFTHPRTHQDYLLAGSLWGLRLYRVTGLDDIQRSSGSLTLPPGDAVVAPS